MSTAFKINGVLTFTSGSVSTTGTMLTSGDFYHVKVQNLGTGNLYVGQSGTEYWALTPFEAFEIDTIQDVFGKCSGVGTTSFVVIEST